MQVHTIRRYFRNDLVTYSPCCVFARMNSRRGNSVLEVNFFFNFIWKNLKLCKLQVQLMCLLLRFTNCYHFATFALLYVCNTYIIITIIKLIESCRQHDLFSLIIPKYFSIYLLRTKALSYIATVK